MTEILLTQSEKRKIEIELTPGTDYTFVEVNPDVVTFDKAKGVLTAKNVLSENGRIIFTPTKNGFSGDPEVLVTKVRELFNTRIEPSISSVTLKENEIIEISINTEDVNFTLGCDGSRKSADIKDNEMTVGISKAKIEEVISGLESI